MHDHHDPVMTALKSAGGALLGWTGGSLWAQTASLGPMVVPIACALIGACSPAITAWFRDDWKARIAAAERRALAAEAEAGEARLKLLGIDLLKGDKP